MLLSASCRGGTADHPGDVKTWHDFMENVLPLNRDLGAAVKAGDFDAVVKAAKGIEDLRSGVEGRELATRPGEFRALDAELRSGLAALAKDAAARDKGRAEASFRALSATCASCHDKFREKER